MPKKGDEARTPKVSLPGFLANAYVGCHGDWKVLENKEEIGEDIVMLGPKQPP